jgi:acetolactate synthase-1/3 small subunit
MKHIISVLVENKVGVLSHVAGLFSSRGYNIDSVAVAETHEPTVSRMTIVVDADEKILEQIMKQLRKLIDVVKVQDVTGEDFIDRELVLVKVSAKPGQRSEIMQVADAFRARTVDVNPRSLTIEITGNQAKISAMLELLREFGIKEIVRTGRIAMSRGSSSR